MRLETKTLPPSSSVARSTMDSSLVFFNTPYIVGKVLKSTKKRDNFQALEFKRLRNHLPKIFCAKSMSKRRNFECKKMRGSIFTADCTQDTHEKEFLLIFSVSSESL